ncbi:leucine-rich repeat and death domain-containing protein 1-like [Pectinophora gossypiella]|uniref:leucine-rich repeat and death domain-containing protein 1-like n=1 Tax=Pectinophora gossypiella TaxID=13191 RepID=UPI00214E1228|nr:leucine-rich repeat and death domain-containing protein 1-like [Pectinophora gossypiella]
MEKGKGRYEKNKNGGQNGIVKEIKIESPHNLSSLDLSKRSIVNFNESAVFPLNLTDLNLSHNDLMTIPKAVLKLAHIKFLDISHNSIQCFDELPNFCHTIEELNLSHNQLFGPPNWVWSECPRKLDKLYLNDNIKITSTLQNEYFQELLQYKVHVTHVVIYNCRLKNSLELLGTFPKAKSIIAGIPDLTTLFCNHLDHIPCPGLDQCCDVERLNLSNTNIYTIHSNIDMYKNLVEINLSNNNINSLPNNFCNLENLEICILSCNNILYLPDDMVKLKKVWCLGLDCNQLCMLPEGLCSLPNLRILDLYDNSLCEVEKEVKQIAEVDLAQNYFVEPGDREYLAKKEKLRLSMPERLDGRKIQMEQCESEHSSGTTDDEELIAYMNNIEINRQNAPTTSNEIVSSPEDWDSDDYWVPRYFPKVSVDKSPWHYYIERKMQEGNFCPIDLHTIPVAQKVQYEKMCNPKPWVPVEGQFDDNSDDDSWFLHVK